MVTYNFANEGLRAQKTTNFLAGFVLALAALFVALEYTQREVIKVINEDIVYVIKVEEDMIPLTFNSKPILAPPATSPAAVEYTNEVMDDLEIPDEDIESPEETNQILPIQEGTGVLSGVITAPDPETDGDRLAIFPGDPEPAIIYYYDVLSIPEYLYDWLKKNLKYPEVCREKGIQGRVVARLCVDRDGSIAEVKILRSPDPALSKEVERVAMMMPKWEPARQGNKFVCSMVNLPVMFKLE